MDLDYNTNEPKMEKDYSESVDSLLLEIDAILKTGEVKQAIEKLKGLEKKTRSAADLASTSRLLVKIVEVCGETNEWTLLTEEVAALSKKHGQLKQAITKMVQKAMDYVDKTGSDEAKMSYIEKLRSVTEGKIYVEVERARLTRTLVSMLEAQGDIVKACDTLLEVQVETFSSMERREKTDFILEQIRLCLEKKDYVRTAIISHKINPKYFEKEEAEDLRLRFYYLMIKYDLHEENYLEVCRHYNHIYQTKSVRDDATKWPEVLQNIVLYVVLAHYDNEQSDMLHRIQKDHNLEKLELCAQLTKCFTMKELTRWPAVESIYGPTFRNTEVFSPNTENGDKRWKALHDRVIEHNIRVVAGYYTRITISRLTELLDLSESDVESFLSKAVVDKSIYARIDRPTGIVSFVKPRNGEEQLDEWASDVNKLLGLVEKTRHLIAKEEIVHKIARAI